MVHTKHPDDKCSYTMLLGNVSKEGAVRISEATRWCHCPAAQGPAAAPLKTQPGKGPASGTALGSHKHFLIFVQKQEKTHPKPRAAHAKQIQ
ncbi:hypothetical protein EK904_007780 [Melospiza melodia maxima]|nr:hypothetical protein EK904_007780 [Melospiza melodia maxima]